MDKQIDSKLFEVHGLFMIVKLFNPLGNLKIKIHFSN